MGNYMSTNSRASPPFSQPPQHNHSPPSNDGPLETGKFVFPPEWDRHIATILGFPSRASCLESMWEKNCEEIIDLAAAISQFEPIRLYARPEDVAYAQSLINRKVRIPSKVHIIPLAINHCWVRDTGPVYVHDSTGQRLAISFEFNEWGNKNGWDGVGGHYRFGNPSMNEDRLLENTDFARNVIASDNSPTPVRRVVPRIRTEGGGLVVDGEGTLLVAESYLVDENRNPGMTRDDIERELRRLLGVTKVIWCPGLKNKDITDAHLDAEVRFARPGVLVMTRHDPGAGEWVDCGREILQIMQRETDAKGRRFEIHIIDEPSPEDIGCRPDDEAVTSYPNGYFCNGGFILPAFGSEEHDRRAKETWQAVLPDRKVVQVPLRAIPLSGGVIHCVTQQVPAPKKV